MAERQQRNNKEAKKQKKDDGGPPKAGTSDRPTPPMTSVLPKGKLKNKAP